METTAFQTKMNLFCRFGVLFDSTVAAAAAAAAVVVAAVAAVAVAAVVAVATRAHL